MQVQDLIALLSETAAKNEYRFENLRARIPLGVFENGEIATAHREEKPDRYHFALCSGEERREFVLSLVLSLACLYDEREASFLILSPHTDYAALLRLDGADISVPYIRNANDLKEALKTVSELISMRALRIGYPRLFIVCDGLDEIEDAAYDDVTDPYKLCLDTVGNSVSEVIAAVDLTKSKFSGFPGALAGIGNCIVTTKGGGKADVTQVGTDSSLGVPREISYPVTDGIERTVNGLNELFRQVANE